MAPRAEFNTEQIRNKARKDLLYLLEGVRKAFPHPQSPIAYKLDSTLLTGTANCKLT